MIKNCDNCRFYGYSCFNPSKEHCDAENYQLWQSKESIIQITEEQAFLLLDSMNCVDSLRKLFVKEWKEKGYIIQEKEKIMTDKERNILKNHIDNYVINNNDTNIEKTALEIA